MTSVVPKSLFETVLTIPKPRSNDYKVETRYTATGRKLRFTFGENLRKHRILRELLQISHENME